MARPSDGSATFGAEPLDAGAFCLYRAHTGASGTSRRACSIRVGKVSRVAPEVSEPFAVVETYWPLLRPNKCGEKVNLFGTWTKGADPVIEGEMPTNKKHALARCLLLRLRCLRFWCGQ